MQSLFSDAGRRCLDALVRPDMLCGFDFDGTLAPIVERPDDAALPPNIRDRLLQLRQHAPVAIITGRSVADIRTRLGFDPDYVVGNHGLEGVPGQEEEAQRHLALCRAWRTTLEQTLREEDISGIFLEDKQFSLSLHYRLAASPQQAERRLRAVLAHLEPAPRIVEGKAIFSLLPQDAGHKGTALEQLMRLSGAASALYVGDDVTDEDVFRLQRRDLLTVRVEPGTESVAQFFLPAWQDIALLLDDLLRRLQAAQPAV